jgi:hypothetical protein
MRLGLVVGAILLLIQIFLRNRAPEQAAPERSGGPATPPPRPRPEAPGRAAGADDDSAGATAAEPGTEPATVATTEAPAAPEAATTAAWVEPESGSCPVTHPVKVKLASGIFHLPGGLAYERTAPDRCYRDAAAAEADGFRPSKR